MTISLPGKKPTASIKTQTIPTEVNATSVGVTSVATFTVTNTAAATTASENILEKICSTLGQLLNTQQNIQLAATTSSRQIDRKRQRTPSPPIRYPRRPELQWNTSPLRATTRMEHSIPTTTSHHKYPNERQAIVHDSKSAASIHHNNFRERQTIVPTSYKTSREGNGSKSNAQVKHRVCDGINTKLLFTDVTTPITIKQSYSVDPPQVVTTHP